MPDVSRRQFLAGTTAAAAAVTAGVPFVHAQKRGGTIRFIPHADLKVLDPIWTTAYITRNHSYMIYDTLFGTDEKLKTEWVRATDRAKQRQIAEDIQKIAYDEVMYVPFGQWVLPTAYRKTVQGVLQFPAPLFWNVSIA